MFNLDDPLLYLTENDPFTHRMAMQGITITGGVGSGKTSGSGRTLLSAYMQNGYGMCCLTVKPDETEFIETVAEEQGRSDDVIKIAPNEPWFYDFMEEEAKRGKGSETETIVSLFLSLVEIAQGSLKSKESYWLSALRQLLRNAVTTLLCAEETVTIENCYKLIIQAPTSLQMFRSKEFREESYCYYVLNKASEKVDAAVESGSTEIHHRDFDISFMYWSKEFPNLAEKTRSVIVSMFTTTADVFLRGSLRTIFSEQKNKRPCPPSLAREKKILIVDMSVKIYESVGVISNSVYALLFTKEMERQTLQQTGTPAALYADEFTHFLSGNDYLNVFLQTSRGAGVSVCLCTQSLNNLTTKYGENGEAKAYNLLGLIGTHIAHNNTCVKTNNYFAEKVGYDWEYQHSSSINTGEDRDSITSGLQEQRRYVLEPIRMTELLTGGAENNLTCEAIAYNGRRWSNGEKYLNVYFQQS